MRRFTLELVKKQTRESIALLDTVEFSPKDILAAQGLKGILICLNSVLAQAEKLELDLHPEQVELISRENIRIIEFIVERKAEYERDISNKHNSGADAGSSVEPSNKAESEKLHSSNRSKLKRKARASENIEPKSS